MGLLLMGSLLLLLLLLLLSLLLLLLFFLCVFFCVRAAWLDLRSAITVRASKGSINRGLEQPLGGGLSRGAFVRSMAMKSCSLFFVCACMAPREAVFKHASAF